MVYQIANAYCTDVPTVPIPLSPLTETEDELSDYPNLVHIIHLLPAWGEKSVHTNEVY